ncbi:MULTISPECIES: tyrosine-type recombinase/integrase [Enterococcus]|uniref:Tyr recombinase domain-containing protein n=1 Tax=Enterococcus faecium TaxID=1352 RepID=A0AAI8PXZ0_ENTFC|nr:hypothetical protein D9Z05_10505 [Enterococcus faecium]MBQ0860856.1 tyrosine-type recombinase/integrase [Enterococcus lactis]NRE83459.1 tyrosine-type recombinase/integrase [Enterococcus faecium]PHL16122.1 hypothetical protein CQR38_04215 [Enterococcus faecium]QPB63071.1 tyrosine-type recombinase/integrase [Enterococcus faecium]
MTHCSLLLETGTSIKEIQKRMDHTDIKTTINVYVHVTDKKRNHFAKFMSI